MKKWLSILLKILELLLVLLVLFFGLLQTPPGKRLLASELSKAMGRSGNLEVKIGRITGFIPVQIAVESLEVGDREGTWLTAKKLHFRWAVRDGLDGIVNVEELGAEIIELHRLPKAEGDEKPPKEKGGFQPMEIVLGNLVIEKLVLGEAITGVPLEYAVRSGGMRLRESGQLSGSLEVTGDADGRVDFSAPPLGTPDWGLKALAELKELRKPDIGLQGLHGTAEATLSTEGIHLLLAASADGIELDIDAHATTENGSWAVDFRRLKIKYREAIAFALKGTLGTERIDLSGALAEFDLGQLPWSGISNFAGRVGGRIAVTGSLSEPAVAAAFDVLDFTTAQASLDELPDLNFHVDVELRDGRFSGRSSITNAVSGSMAARVDMPCAFALQPFRFKMETRQLAASFKADVDLGILNGLTFFNDQHVQGRLDSDLVYDARLETRLVGRVDLENGAYEHYGWGVVVRDIQAGLDTEPDGLVVRKMTATDGGEGRVAVAGRIGIWDPELPLELQVDIEKANLVRRDEVEAVLSGAIHVGGRLSRPSVTGRLVIDRADILLDNIAPPEPRLLTDFDANEPIHEAAVSKAKAGLPFALDLDVSMPDQIFASASVIDSVWGGDLKIKDAPGGVSVAGTMRPRRGYLSFIGKKFRLTDDGRIEFDGAVPASPSLNISAEYFRSDIVAHLVLTGKLNNPQYALTSTPALPEDEVLSQVLFGRDTSSISPYQAYQIAAAARQLSGGVRGPGFMYQMRQALSIDSLEWREPDTPDGKSSVVAGKYVTPGLYVEVNNTLEDKEGSTGMMAEYEVTKHFSVETSTGPQMRPGIGVNWKNDY
jgi:autotransporter translocation and assembly factor TamB